MNTETEFNADQFVQDNIDAAMSTKMELIPKGEYSATISEIGKARKIVPSDTTKPAFAAVDVLFDIDAPQVAEAIGRNKLTGRYSLMLDLDPATGKLDARKGKNTRLGRLRELAGQNNPGQAWQWGYLVGTGPYTVRIDHEEDKRDADLPLEERRTYDRIVAVTKPA